MSKSFRKNLGIFLFTVITFFVLDEVKPPAVVVTDSAQEATGVEMGLEKRICDSIKNGETLSSILTKHQICSATMLDIIDSFKSLYSVTRLRTGDRYEIVKDSSNTFKSFSYKPSLQEEYRVSVNDFGQFDAAVEKIELEKKEKYLTGTIQTSLYNAILDKGENPELLFLFTDIFQWDIDFFIDPRVGDEFKIIYEKYYLPQTGQFVKYGRIIAGQYIFSNKEELTALYFENHPASAGYYDLNGNSFQKTFLKSPLNYRRISSFFSHSRHHPILKISRPHYGVDYAAPAGTPVSAAADGVVIGKGYDRSIGNFVKIRHKNARFITLYGHLSRFQEGIYEGIRVNQKDIIGYVGKTGLATGPHLHYAFYDNGRPIDPLKIKNTSGDPVLEVNTENFALEKNEVMEKLQYLDNSRLPLIWLTSNQVHYNRYSIPAR
ncbi:MAG: M23 family metallopeptidase [Candidatus Zhuqueibacterota bacterium]